MDWKDLAPVIGKAAPILGALFAGATGGISVAVGGLVSAALGVDNNPDAIHEAIANDPMASLKLAQYEMDNQVKLQAMQFAHAGNLIAADTARIASEVADRDSARKANSSKDAVWWIAVIILLTFAGTMTGVLYGCWLLLQGSITIKDVSVVAAISGLVGSIVGYIAANAQTVINFIYGGSLGTSKKDEAVSSAVKQAIDIAGAR